MNNKLVLRIILVALAVFATVFTVEAQEQKLNLPNKRMSVSDIFDEIRRQAYLGISYRTDQIDPDRMVALPAAELSLSQVIELIILGTDIDGVIEGKVIVFAKRTADIPVAKERFEPMPASEYRESLGLRPRSVLLEGEQEQRMMLEQTKVEIELPMESYRFTTDYTANQAELPRFAIKTNLLYWLITLKSGGGHGIGTLTPNLSFEFGLGKKTSLEIGGSVNPWNLQGNAESNRKLTHWLVKPEFRYWLCQRFDGHFFGAHLIAGHYNIGTYQIPLLFNKEYRYFGNIYGAGISYGYSLSLHKRWSAEFAVGAGVMLLKYDRYDCEWCTIDSVPLKKWYFGPTNASVSIVFLIK